MISIYLIIAIVCAILLIVTIALGGLMGEVDVGGDFDVGGPDLDVGGPDIDLGYGDFAGPGISPLSLPIILAFGTTFGGVGALLEQAEFNPFIIPMVAVLVSVITSGGMYFAITWLFVKTQASSSVDLSSLVGQEGTVSVAIKPGKLGQIVVVTEERGRTLIPAVSEETIPTDTVVEIQAVVGNGVRVIRK
ncbi:MAG: hypothetical protein ACE5QF_05005 [Thermoplasmata archaeon]